MRVVFQISLLLLLVAATSAAFADQTKLGDFVGSEAEIALASGAKVQGKITAADDEYVSVEVTVGGRKFARKYALDKISSVTSGGQRIVFGGLPTANPGNPTDPPTGSAANGRTKSEVEALIDKTGRTQPDWWQSVKLNYPDTLDLSWPMRPTGNWNARRNVGQYIWDIINPNPSKWKEGTRLVHYLLVKHQEDAAKRRRGMETLASMYHRFFQDYARAAFWWQLAGVGKPGYNTPAVVQLAECYYKLGNKKMALDLLSSQPTYYNTIKLMADMGETDSAVQLAERIARSSRPDMAYLYAGDACRIAGDYDKAVEYYKKVLAVPASGRFYKIIQRNQGRARENIQSIRIFDALDLSRIPDGTYRGTATGYVGAIQVEVTVKSGRIESVRVTSHKEKQFYSSMTDIPNEIIKKQGVKGVAAVTGATITSEAIVNATAKALSGAK